MPHSRIVFALLGAIAVAGVARGEPEGASAGTDAGGQDGPYVITSGKESLFSDMLGASETLPGGCTLSEGQIDRTVVVATYSCGTGEVVLRLGHTADAPAGAVRTQRFAVTVDRGTPPAGFVDAVTARIRDHEGGFAWTSVNGPPREPWRWFLLLAGLALIAALVFRAVRRRRGS